MFGENANSCIIANCLPPPTYIFAQIHMFIFRDFTQFSVSYADYVN